MTHAEFKQVFEENRMFVFYYIKSKISNKEDAEDLTNQVFISLWKNMSDDIETSRIQQYLIAIAKNKCTDHSRRKGARMKIVNILEWDDVSDIEHTEIKLDVLYHAYTIIESLPPLQKKFIKMKYIEGYEPGTIAQLLNRNAQSIRNQLCTALATIRRELKNLGCALD